jgi:hypothetical protein
MNRKQRGRPDKDFWTDPDRYLMMLAVTLQRLFGMSVRQSFYLVAALVLGKKTNETWREDRHRRGVGFIRAGVERTYHRATRLGGTSADFRNYASTLRKKMRRIDDEAALRWLDLTAHGVGNFLVGGSGVCEFEEMLRYVLACAEQTPPETLPLKFLTMLRDNLPPPDLFPQVRGPEMT